MQLKTARRWALLSLGLSLATPAISHAEPDANYSRLRDQMLGSYYGLDTRENYRFRSDGTYTFTAGTETSADGNISHSGRWSLLSYQLKSGETDDGTVQLRSTSRVVMEGHRRRTLKANRTFKLRVAIPKDAEGADIGFLIINGRVFNLSN